MTAAPADEPTEATRQELPAHSHCRPWPLDALAAKRYAAELNTKLQGVRINRVQQFGSHEITFSLWGAGVREEVSPSSSSAALKQSRLPADNQRLLMNLDPNLPFCSLLKTDTMAPWLENHRERPTGFCMLLRKYLQGAKIAAVSSLAGEPVLCFQMEYLNDLGDATPIVLILELMGKYTNLILVERLHQKILGVAHPVTESMSRLRLLEVGVPYEPPPRPANRTPVSATVSHTPNNPDHPDSLLDFVSALPPDNAWAELQAEAWLLPEGQAFEKALSQWAGKTLWGIRPRALEALLTVAQQRLDSPPIRTPDTLLALLQQLEQQTETLQVCWQMGGGGAWLLLPHNWPIDPEAWQVFPNVLTLMQRVFWPQFCQDKLTRKRQQLLGQLSGKQRRIEQRCNHLENLSPEEITQFRVWGDSILVAWSEGLLPEHPQQLNAPVVSIQNPHEGCPIAIDVDNRYTWPEQAERFYRQARKAEARLKYFLQQQAQLTQQQQYLSELRCLIEQSETLEELAHLAQELVAFDTQSAFPNWQMDPSDTPVTDKFAQNANPPKTARTSRKQKSDSKGLARGSKKAGKPKQAFTGVLQTYSQDGHSILVGKTGAANGLLCGRMARPRDLWLHVHQMPGSHVLIQRQDNRPISDETLLEAAALAAHFSAGRLSNHVPVVYTESRYVRKIPGSYPGHVTYTHEQTVHVTPQAATPGQWLEDRL
ncbi:MAG: NFACT RNA binding domain-containing protein [Candidatus Melainabacteria bacterium]|nr:NFACT RNA binding domain-containing protein [Candidatus Melainabacteria bacterium]